MKSFICTVLLVVLGLVGGGQIAFADTISFANTGVAADGSLLAAGSADPNYALLYSSDGGSYTATAAAPNGAWISGTGTAGWIAPGPTGSQSADAGYYVYETTLNLTGYDASTASLSGNIASDDGVYIYLNEGGSAVFSSPAGFSSMTPFLINSGFVSGVNQVDFVVFNNSGPSGLLVDDTVAVADAQTPEPGTWLLMGTGMVLGTVQIIRRQRSATQ